MKAVFVAVLIALLGSGCGNRDVENPQAIGAAPISAMCMKDLDCKGDRICDKGTCVAPPVTAQVSASAAQVSPTQSASPKKVASGSDAPCVSGKDGALALGAPYNDGAYLCREPLDEPYYNDWYGALSSPGIVVVQSDGKSVVSGKLRIDCASGDTEWQSVTAFDTPMSQEEISAEVPRQVATAALQQFCKG